MVHHRTPPELRHATWTEGTVWDVLVAIDAVPSRLTSPIADHDMSARQRHQLRREQELLHTTRITYIMPHPGNAHQAPQPWLYIQTQRAGLYRVNDTGVIERSVRFTRRLGGTRITMNRWNPSTLRGVRWLQGIADGLVVRKMNPRH